MSTGHHLAALPALLLLAPLAGDPLPALAAGVVTGGTADDGYVASAFEKLGRQWSPPPGLHGDFKVQVEVRINERGGIAGCRTRQSSGMDAFDAAACGAVEQAGNLGVPPGGKPMTLYCTFQSQREHERRPDPDERLQKEVRARMEAENRFSTQRAGWAEEDARYKAEKAARAQGQTFEGYDFVPGQNIPGAREILERPSRVQPGPQHPQAGAGRGRAAAGSAAGKPGSARGAGAQVLGAQLPGAGVGSTLPDGEPELAVVPGQHPTGREPAGARESAQGAKGEKGAKGAEARPAPRMLMLSDVSAAIFLRRRASKAAPAQVSARPPAQSRAVSGGRRAGKTPAVPAGNRQQSAAAGGKTSPRLPAGRQDAVASPATMPVVHQDAPDAPGAPGMKGAKGSPAPVKTPQPRAEQSQPANAGKAPSASAGQPMPARTDGDSAKANPVHASSRSVQLVSHGGEASQPAGAKPGEAPVPSKPSAGAAAPTPSPGEVRGRVVYPPAYGNARK